MPTRPPRPPFPAADDLAAARERWARVCRRAHRMRTDQRAADALDVALDPLACLARALLGRALVVVLVALAIGAGGCAEPPISQWEAAHALAERHCADPGACVRGWCESEATCAAPVEDLNLFDACLLDLEPVCWLLFR